MKSNTQSRLRGIVVMMARMMSKTVCLCLISLALLMAGCASTGSLRSDSAMTVNLSTYRAVDVHVTSQLTEATEEIPALAAKIVAAITAKNIFDKVLVGSASLKDADLQLDVAIIQLKEVTSAQRILLGALAGQAKINVNVALIDLKTKEKIGSFDAEGLSSGGTIFAGTTEQALEKASEQIATFMVNNAKR